MDLQKELAQRPSKAKAKQIAQYIGSDQTWFDELMNHVQGGDEVVARYGSWLISHCMESNPQLVLPHLATLIDNLANPKTEGSVLRSSVKALSGSDIPDDLQGPALNHCFDLLLNPKTAIAVQVHAMQTVFNISKNEPDLLRELATVIEDGMEHGSAAYKARGRRILGKIRKLV